MDREADRTRRGFLQASALLGAGIIASRCAPTGEGESVPKHNDDKREAEGPEEVSPAEDLMREHGVLKRVLLVYGEGVRRLDANVDLPPEAIVDAATIIRTFIEGPRAR